MDPKDENNVLPEQADAKAPEEEAPQASRSFSVIADELELENAGIFRDRSDPEPAGEAAADNAAPPVYPSAAKQTHRRRNLRSLIAVGVIVLVTALLVGGVFLLVRQRDEQAQPPAVEPVQSVEETPQVQAENNASAPVRAKAKGFPVSFSSNAIRSIAAVGANIYVLTDETLSLVTPSGACQMLKVIGYVEPVIVSCGKYGLVFDRLTGKYLVFCNAKIVLEGTSEDQAQILNADIAADGSFLLATKGKESASLLTYYDKDGKMLFRWTCAKDHIVAVSLAENRRDILCAALNAKNGEILTRLYLLDTYSDQTQWEYSLKGAAAIDCCFVSGSKIAVVCADRRVVIDTKKSKPTPHVFEYPEAPLAIDSDGEYTAVVTPKFGSFDAYEVRLLTGSNKVSYTFQTDARVIGVRCVGKRSYLLTEKAVLTVGPSGKGSVVTQIPGVELGLDVLNGHVYHYSLGYLFKN